MRIQRLDLLAYGPFRNRSLDFGAPGLHLVHGPNEAGKSTTLRAIVALLFGIERSTGDAHLHKPSELRIGGVLVSEGLEPLHLVRRKGVSKGGPNTLLDEQGRALDDTALARMLRGMNEETFRHAFGLDHRTLAKGAEALLAGRGDLGESLFDAGVGGGGDVQRLLAELEREADELYTPRGSTRPLNEALKDFAAAQRKVKETQSLPEAHAKQARELDEARSVRDRAIAERTALARTKSLLERAVTRAPLVRQRGAVAAARDAYGPFAEPLRHALPRVSNLARVDDDEAERARLERALVVNAARLEELARSTSPSASSEPVDPARERRILKLCVERTELTAGVRHLRSEVSLAQASLSEAVDPRGAARTVEDASELRRLVDAARTAGDAESRLEDDVRRAARKRIELDGRLRALGLFEGSAQELAARRLPVAALLDGFVKEQQALDDAMRRLDDDGAKANADLQSLERQRAVHGGDFAPPTEAELRAARAARDAALEAARDADPSSSSRRWTELDRSMREADQLADRMIREADRVTALARLRAEAQSLEAQLRQLETQRTQKQARRAALMAEHEALWREVGLTRVLEPTAMRGWLEAAERQLADHRELAEHEAGLLHERERLARMSSELRAAFRDLTGVELETAGLRAAVHAAGALLDELTSRARTAEAEKTRRAKQEGELAKRRVELAQHEARLEELAAELAGLVVPLGLAADAPTDEVNAALEASRAMVLARREQGELTEALRAVSARLDAFYVDLADVLATAAPDLVSLRPRDAAGELLQRATRLEKLDAELASLDLQLASVGDVPLDPSLAVTSDDVDGLRAALAEVDAAWSEKSSEVDRATRDLGSKEEGLRLLQTDLGAAEAAADAEQALARVRSHTERYARAKLAAWILAREIARYREANQGPLLASTSDFFARLTEDAFSGVRAGYDDKDQPTLVCVRRSGAEVEVAGLSEGTRDQLYLALRLASLLRFAETGGSMPLVLDDLLVQFDDGRSRAALRVLAALSDRIQILLFTHHQRLVDLAREAVPSDRLVVHELVRQAPLGTTDVLPELQGAR